MLYNNAMCWLGGVYVFSDQVRYVRLMMNLSQKKMAQLLSVSYATINRWENTKNEPSKLAQNNFIDVDNLKKL